jgi:hypothetical protein
VFWTTFLNNAAFFTAGNACIPVIRSISSIPNLGHSAVEPTPPIHHARQRFAQGQSFRTARGFCIRRHVLASLFQAFSRPPVAIQLSCSQSVDHSLGRALRLAAGWVTPIPRERVNIRHSLQPICSLQPRWADQTWSRLRPADPSARDRLTRPPRTPRHPIAAEGKEILVRLAPLPSHPCRS